MAQLQRSDDLETTLLWIVTGYRVFAAVWLSILGLVVLSSDTTPVANPPVVAATIGLVVAWAATATAAALVKPPVASTWWFVAIDLAVSAWTVAAGTVAVTIQFAGGYPLAGAFGAIYAFGAAGGAVGAATLTATGLFPLLKNESQSFSQDVANAIAFLFSVGAVIGVAAALRTSDQRRVAAEEALATERTERARAEEHAEVAAHLHDSVLQTLALIQRDPASTTDIRGLARHQERELRTWLYPNPDTANTPSGGFREALVAVCSDVEDMGAVHVEVVVVGNTDGLVDPIVRAAREAILNARKHAEVELVSVYGEANADEVLVFVKDRGKGFEPTTVDESRHGIRESIVGRMERHGGSAEIISAVGSGTEIRLRLPLGTS
jgi:signal transduction histidine kinase